MEALELLKSESYLTQIQKPSSEFLKDFNGKIEQILSFIFSHDFSDIDVSVIDKIILTFSSSSKELKRKIIDDSKFISYLFDFPKKTKEASEQTMDIYCRIVKGMNLFSNKEFLSVIQFEQYSRQTSFIKCLLNNIKYDAFYKLMIEILQDQTFFLYFENIHLSKILFQYFEESDEDRDKFLYLLNILAQNLNQSSLMMRFLFSKKVIKKLIKFAFSVDLPNQNAVKNAFLLLNTILNHKFGVSPRVITQISSILPDLSKIISNEIQNKNQEINDAVFKLSLSIIKSLLNAKKYATLTTGSSINTENDPSFLKPYNSFQNLTQFLHPISLKSPIYNLNDNLEQWNSTFIDTLDCSMLSVVKSCPAFQFENSPCFTITEVPDESKDPKLEENIFHSSFTNDEIKCIKQIGISLSNSYFQDIGNRHIDSYFYNYLEIVSECLPLFNKIIKKCDLFSNIMKNSQKLMNSEDQFALQSFIQISKLIQDVAKHSDEEWQQFVNELEKKK